MYKLLLQQSRIEKYDARVYIYFQVCDALQLLPSALYIDECNDALTMFVEILIVAKKSDAQSRLATAPVIESVS